MDKTSLNISSTNNDFFMMFVKKETIPDEPLTGNESWSEGAFFDSLQTYRIEKILPENRVISYALWFIYLKISC